MRLAAGAASNILSFPQNGAKVFAMRHRMRVAKLNRPADQRKALVRGLVTQVLRHGRITTTKVGPHAPLSACARPGHAGALQCPHLITAERSRPPSYGKHSAGAAALPPPWRVPKLLRRSALWQVVVATWLCSLSQLRLAVVVGAWHAHLLTGEPLLSM